MHPAPQSSTIVCVSAVPDWAAAWLARDIAAFPPCMIAAQLLLTITSFPAMHMLARCPTMSTRST